MYPVARVIADLQSLKAAGVQGVFIVDDNITSNVGRLKELCRAIIDAGLEDLDYIVQASVSGIASPAERTMVHREGWSVQALLLRGGFPGFL